MATELEQLTEGVIAHYLRTGEDATVAELATDLGWSEAKVRRVLATAPGGVPEGLYAEARTRQSHSRNYRYMAAGTHRVMVYGPHRSTLRALLLRHTPPA